MKARGDSWERFGWHVEMANNGTHLWLWFFGHHGPFRLNCSLYNSWLVLASVESKAGHQTWRCKEQGRKNSHGLDRREIETVRRWCHVGGKESCDSSKPRFHFPRAPSCCIQIYNQSSETMSIKISKRNHTQNKHTQQTACMHVKVKPVLKCFWESLSLTCNTIYSPTARWCMHSTKLNFYKHYIQ
jgi:hypothetical protein